VTVWNIRNSGQLVAVHSKDRAVGSSDLYSKKKCKLTSDRDELH